MNKKIALLILVAACGGGDDSNTPDAPPRPDSPPTPDAAPACTTITVGTPDILGGNDTNIVWHAPVTETLGGDAVTFRTEFWAGISDPLLGNFDLAAAPDDNYMTCASCILAFTTDVDGNVARIFFQTAGSETLNANPFATPEPSVRNLDASWSGLVLSEITIDPDTGASTVVPDGECLQLAPTTQALQDDDVPNAWTCTDTAWADAATCDCVCGVSDPDCGGAGVPTNGCGVGESCFNDACVLPPPNDTCATGLPLVAGTPLTGTTIAAVADYSAGLEGPQCTTFTQDGPDVAYTTALTAGQNITVSLTGADALFDASLSLVGPGGPGVCNADPIATCVAGADLGLNGDDETFTFDVVTTGNYYIIVDTFYAGGPNSHGNFTLGLTVN